MAVEVGQFVRGTVVRLLEYGALVRLEDGSTGLVHISEIAQTFVRNVGDYLQVNDPVMVKVLAAGERGRIELSLKQAKAAGFEVPEGTPRAEPAESGAPTAAVNGSAHSQRSEPPAEGPPRRESRASFEEKMGDFMRSSAERLGDIKRNIENKRGGKKPR